MKTVYVALLLWLCMTPMALLAQSDPEPGTATDFSSAKKFETPLRWGDVSIRGIRNEVVNNHPCVIYELETQFSGLYVTRALGNFTPSNPVYITSAKSGEIPSDLEPDRARYSLKIGQEGWQVANLSGSRGEESIALGQGKVDLYFFTKDSDFPLVDRVSLTEGGSDPDFDDNAEKVKAFIEEQVAMGTPDLPKDDESGAKVVPNPLGTYSHQLNEWYSYSTFYYIYLTAGTWVDLYTVGTGGGTNDPVLHLFDPNNPDARSWTNDDYTGLESRIQVVIPYSTTYVLLCRPYSDNVKGITKIYRNGTLLLNNTPLGGRRFTHAAYSGVRNFFTSYMTGDTRLFALNNIGNTGHVRGYNDDYSWGGGNGLRSRVVKNFPTAVTATFICAYSTSVFSSGITDTYMGNLNGNAYTYFPSYTANNCIQSAPASGVYNCISWSGGVTNYWHWPPYNPAYNYGGVPELVTFDRYYANTPARYTGAWDYNRGDANAGNSVIDLWKIGSGTTGYTHASVKKPGNNNPHGYDWESKPGSLERSFHNRYALVGASYGNVTDYYVFGGTTAKSASGETIDKDKIISDADAVRQGYDVYETVRLSNAAQLKLNTLLGRISTATANQFHHLYDAWKGTWGNFAWASNPDTYTKNHEYDALLSFCQSNGNSILPLLFSRYIQGDFLSTPLLWKLTVPTYEPLLEEVHNDIVNNPNDAQGRYIIRSTFGNNVLYIEKILRDLQAAPAFTVTVSPNPVTDRMNVDVTLTAESNVTVNITSSRTNAKVTPARDTKLAAGTHRFTVSTRQIAGGAGDIILVQVQVDGTTQTVKAIVGQ